MNLYNQLREFNIVPKNTKILSTGIITRQENSNIRVNDEEQSKLLKYICLIIEPVINYSNKELNTSKAKEIKVTTNSEDKFIPYIHTFQSFDNLKGMNIKKLKVKK